MTPVYASYDEYKLTIGHAHSANEFEADTAFESKAFTFAELLTLIELEFDLEATVLLTNTPRGWPLVRYEGPEKNIQELIKAKHKASSGFLII